MKASAEEVKVFAEKNIPKGGDPHAEGGGKITEWEAAWNVTNAIQVKSQNFKILKSNIKWYFSYMKFGIKFLPQTLIF